MSVPRPPALADPLATETFGPSDLGRLESVLRDQDDATSIEPFDGLAQVQLDHQGLTLRGGFRYTSLAFRQLCTFTVHGLGQALYDLAGVRRPRESAPDRVYALDTAIHVLNTVLALREPLLDGLQLVYDTSRGLIEGFVGAGYRRLGNADLLTRVLESAADTPSRPGFREAVLFGRTMMVRLQSTSPPAVRVDTRLGGEGITPGLYFVNSEVGDGAVRVGHLMFRPDGTASASWSGAGGRLRHQGNRFQSRFSRLLSKAFAWEPDPEATGARFAGLAGASLNMTGDRERQDRRLRSAVARVRSKDFTMGLAARIVRDALAQGSDDVPSPSGDESRETVWPARNLYDFYCATTRAAQRMPISSREKLEYLAHQVLTGRFYPFPL